MVSYAERMLDKWKHGEVRDIHSEMMQLTLEIAAKTLFNADVTSEASDVGAALQMLLADFNDRFDRRIPLPRWLPTPANLRAFRAVRRLDAIIYGFIEQRRASAENPGDLLSLLLAVMDEETGSGMTNRQLRDEAMTLFLAGHETTALALSWTWYLVAQHPDVQAKLVAEWQRVLGGRLPTVADLPQLTYTEMVVREAMRLYPPAYLLGREATKECEIGGYRVPVGTTLWMCQWVVHRDPRNFANAETFDPDRWADGLLQRLPKYAYFPFGGGPRGCIGNTFALMEAVLVLAAIGQKFRFTLLSEHPVTPWPSFTLRPKAGIMMRLTSQRRVGVLPPKRTSAAA